MRRSLNLQNPEGFPKNNSDVLRTRSVDGSSTLSNLHASEDIRSSWSSSEASENESWAIWKLYKAKTADKHISNRTDSYKLAFPRDRENQSKQKENSNPNTMKTEDNCIKGISQLKRRSTKPNPTPRQKRQPNVNNKKPLDLDYPLSYFKKLSVASIYAPKLVNKSPQATARKQKSVFCKQPLPSKTPKEDEDESKQRVSFGHYALLNDRIEKLETHLNDTELSEEWNDLHRIMSGDLENGHPSWQEPAYHPIPDPIAFLPPIPRVRRLPINTEILHYYLLYGIITVLGVVLIALTYVWVSNYNGGISDKINLHILLSMIGFFFLGTQGILAFRTTRYVAKENSPEVSWRATIVHTLIHLTSVVISCTSIAMAFLSRSYTTPPSSNMYTLHAWIGIVTFLLYCLLWLFSLSYYLPQFTPSKRMSVSIHVALGMTSFFMIISSCLSGFMEQAVLSLGRAYSELPPAGVLVNCIGILMMVYCGFVVYVMQTVKDI